MTPEQIKQVQQRSRCLHDEAEVELALDLMARAITSTLRDKNPLVLCIMQGGLIATAKLVTRLEFPLQMDYLHATRYHGSTSGKNLQWKTTANESLQGRAILLVDDILDVGRTLELIIEYCWQQECASVHTAVLLDKQHDRKVSKLRADFVGLEVADHYLFGYGMDYKGYLRNAAGIFAIAEEDR